MPAAAIQPSNDARPWRKHMPALLLYLGLVLLFTWPLVTQLTTHIPGDEAREDYWVHLWTFDWIGQALAERTNPFYTDLIFAPAGVSLTSHNIAWLNIALWLPLRVLVGPVAAYNLIILLIYLFNCFTSYQFAYQLGLGRPSAFLTGCVAGFWPYLISHYDHPNLIMIGWVPLTMLHLQRFWTTGSWRSASLTALALILFGYGRWQLLLIGCALLIPFSFYLLWRHRAVKIGARLAGVAFLIALVIIGLLPILLPLLLEYTGGSNINEVLYPQADGQADLAAYFLPSRYHPLWGDWARQTATFASFRFNTLYIPVLLFSALPLVAWGWWHGRPVSTFWLLLAALLIILALGATLRVRGVLYEQVPMPYDWIDDFTLIRVLRRSDRFNILLGLPLGILAGLGWQGLFKRRHRTLGILWIGFILFEALPLPFPTTDTRITPPWYETLAAEPGDFAILDLPFSRIPQKLSMYYQLTHGKALATGKIARVPPEAFDFILSVPILRELQLTRQVNPQFELISRTVAQLATHDIRYIVLHKTGLDSGQSHAFADWLSYRPVYEDELLAVYSTTPQLEVDFEPLFIFSPQLALIRAEIKSESAELILVWLALSDAIPDQEVCYRLETAPTWQCEPLSRELPVTAWQAGELVRQSLPLGADDGLLIIGLAPAGAVPDPLAPSLQLPH